MIITTYDHKKDKEVKVGIYEEKSKTFIKNVSSRHYMVKEHGYGIQLDVIQELTCLYCQYIIIKTKTKKYKTNFAKWKISGNLKDYGHGQQIFLPISLMEEING